MRDKLQDFGKFVHRKLEMVQQMQLTQGKLSTPRSKHLKHMESANCRVSWLHRFICTICNFLCEDQIQHFYIPECVNAG